MKCRNPNGRRRGAAVVVVLVAVSVLGTLSLAMLSQVGSSFRLNQSVRDKTGARYLAEAGLAEAIDSLRQGGTGDLGSNPERIDYGGGDYWVETNDLGSGVMSVVSTAVQGRSVTRVELVIENENSAFFTWGAFGDEGLALDSNAHVDSYDSRLGTYDDQTPGDSGHVGSNADIYLDQNATVNGNAVPGPTGTVTVDGNAVVTGSTTPADTTQEMPPIDLPSTTSSGPLTVAGNTTYSLPAGDHAFDAFELGHGATLEVEGPATVVFQSANLLSNSEVHVDATNGPVEFFVVNDFLMNSNTLMASTTLSPEDLTLHLLSDNVINPDEDVDLDDVELESNSQLYGSIYAPDAYIEVNSNFELFGSLISRAVRLDSWARVHFDMALLEVREDETSGPSFTKVAWRELPVSRAEIQW